MDAGYDCGSNKRLVSVFEMSDKINEQINIRRLHFSILVWGIEYVNYFLSLSLPSMLATDNLPRLKNMSEFQPCFKIYTNPDDEIMIRNSAGFQRLASIMPVEFCHIGSVGIKNKYSLMNDCHNALIRDARKHAAFLFFLAPDHIYSNGSFEVAFDRIRQGYKAVLIFPVHANRDTFVPELVDRYTPDSDTGVIEIAHRELVSLWQRHIHSMSSFLRWNFPHYPSNGNPCAFIWNTTDNLSWIVRSTQLHPFVLFPESDYLLHEDTIDTILVNRCLGDNMQAISILDDSDMGIQVTLRPVTEKNGAEFDYPNLPAIAMHFNQFRISGKGILDYLKYPIVIHADEITDIDSECQQLVQSSLAKCQSLLHYSAFASRAEFLGTMREYYASLIRDRSVQIIGSGYVAQLTLALFTQMGIMTQQSEIISPLPEGHFIVLATENNRWESLFTQLECRGYRHNADFQISPMCYRAFRRKMADRNLRFYWHNYVDYAKQLGTQEVLSRIVGKVKKVCG